MRIGFHRSLFAVIVLIWQQLVNICFYLLPLATHSESTAAYGRVMTMSFRQHNLLSLPIMEVL